MNTITLPLLPDSMPPQADGNIRGEEDGDVLLLVFDRPRSSANIFDRATLLEFKEWLNHAQQMPGLKGLVLLSAKPTIFLAGADLNALAKLDDTELREFIALGQGIMNQLAALPVPTVAAIHGACVGGGYEMSLACQRRIASSDHRTKIGLPETRLGILPAWGGATRLPRLIGVPGALDIILGGKVLPAKVALKRGLVDEVVPAEYLRELALQRVRENQPLHRHGLLHSRPVNRLLARAVAPRALAKIRDRSGTNYPALEKALEVVTQGIQGSVEYSLELERMGVAELAKTEACRNLLRLMLAQEAAKKRLFAAPQPGVKVSRTVVVGAGVMGAGIAQWLATRGMSVILRDIAPERVAAGLATIAKLCAAGVKSHALSQTEAHATMDRISPAATPMPMERAQVIIEAAVEKMDLKKQIFAQLAGSAGRDTILATNTSALSITELGAATSCPERVLGIHFFNPVHRMQLVEVVRGEKTAPEVVQRAVQFVQQLGKLPVVVRDRPGFLVNRILMPYLIEAAHCFETGASVEEIDRAMKDFGMPMGPLRLMDEVGLDICEDVAATLSCHFYDHLSVPLVLHKMIALGRLGKKKGLGFYRYGGSHEPVVSSGVKKFQKMGPRIPSRDELQRRMVLRMVNEAVRCLDERVAETAADVDFAMVMGTGFAPFRGGPLRYADSLGACKLVNELERLAENGGSEFQPCERLRRMAGKGERFYED
ncbi:MAG: 3-hydroxyacyl-CoA dehydrogenase NAD-binding domain-containing protein [Chthoniobacteraceae bacterium]